MEGKQADAVLNEPLPRQLGASGLWLLMINGIIGAGIFGLGAGAARLAGPASVWLFPLCGLLILPIMLCFAELASRFSGTGGPMRYVGTAFGPLAGFQAGWLFWIARLTAFSANLSLLQAGLGYFWPAVAEGAARVIGMGLITALLVLNNVLGARDAMRGLAVWTALKLLPLLLLLVAGIWAALRGEFAAMSAPVLAREWELGAAVLLLMYAFVGFESGLVPAGEARRPQRDLPRALLLALLVATALYAGLQAVSLATLPQLASSERPLVDVAAVLLGPYGALLLTLGVIASVGGNLAGSMFSTPRVTYALAREGSLPAWFGSVHPRYATPAHSIVFYGACAFVLAAAGSFVWLAGLSVLSRLLLYLACIGAMRSRALPAAEMRLPGGRLIPALAVLICLWLLWQVESRQWLVTAAFVILGSGLFLIARRRGSVDSA